jgi:CubicO group peptidase (beta-lactamase class C family)
VPVIPRTIFRIASVTKQFTASAILKLQEEGKLSVNDTLSKYIPGFPLGDEVTLRHLLTHTSGIHSYTEKPGFIKSVTSAAKPDDLINSFKNDPYDFDPGKKWQYNNSGYFLLGRIVEEVSGQSYGDFLQKKFFQPLGWRLALAL